MARPGSERHSAIESLKERIARDPLSRAFLQLAEEYRKEGRYQEAVKVCLEGLERHPTYHTARISLGRTLMEAGNLVDARRAFSEVLELQPENHLAGKLLAEVQKKTGDGAGAAVPDVVEIFEFEVEPGSGLRLKLEVKMTRGAIGGRTFVVVEKMDLNRSIGRDIVPERRSILEAGVDEFEVIRNVGGKFGKRQCKPAGQSDEGESRREHSLAH